jgi:hypothetical protein
MLDNLSLNILQLMRENAHIHLLVIERNINNESDLSKHKDMYLKIDRINNLIIDLDQCINKQKNESQRMRGVINAMLTYTLNTNLT